MSDAPVRDFSLLLDASLVLDAAGKPRWHYSATLFAARSETPELLAQEPLTSPFHEIAAEVRQAASAEYGGARLFGWAFPPNTELRRLFLQYCEEAAQVGSVLRLRLAIGAQLARFTLEMQGLERQGLVSWEGFWVPEWADPAHRPPGVESPFLALNPWMHIVRCPLGVDGRRRFTVPGRVNALIIVSNPPPGSLRPYQHIKTLEGMLLRIYRPFHSHPSVGWVYPLRNPTKVAVAQCIRQFRPHMVIYLGHGYCKPCGSGLVLVQKPGGAAFEEVSGLRKDSERETELEQVLAGKDEALIAPAKPDAGLPEAQRPRLLIAFACEATPAAPALLRCGVPAVLAMRRQIPDTPNTEAMVEQCVDAMTNVSNSLEEAVAGLRQFLEAQALRFADERLHFSVPVLHLAPNGGQPVNGERR
jgi:hypothetical protein